jgi:hypothetical protein
LNELTARNLDAWQAMQRGLMETAAKVVPTAPTGSAGKKSR